MSINKTISIIGLGYVGLPLAVAFSKHCKVIAYDHNQQRIQELQRGFDRTGEITTQTLQDTTLIFTAQTDALTDADIYIIAVPTPIDHAKNPDLQLLREASKEVGKHINSGDLVIYESTVYPGTTRQICIPLLEHESGLTAGTDFGVGYSPERVNPHDKQHTLANITKLVAGIDERITTAVKSIYETIINADVVATSSIEVAEAAKIIENTQRDLNVALVNELAIICNHIGIDTTEVLAAAATKWNFIKFKPGLVGGHCIGVDPYYLTHCARQLGYHPEVILAGRKINDGMGKFIAEQAIRLLMQRGYNKDTDSVTILGLTFKENCADLRNSGVVNIIRELHKYEINVHVHDPIALNDDAKALFDIHLTPWHELPKSIAVIVAVAHDDYTTLDLTELLKLVVPQGIVLDIKSIFDRAHLEEAGLTVWRL